jgi:hypothetical protein
MYRKVMLYFNLSIKYFIIHDLQLYCSKHCAVAIYCTVHHIAQLVLEKQRYADTILYLCRRCC